MKRLLLILAAIGTIAWNSEPAVLSHDSAFQPAPSPQARPAAVSALADQASAALVGPPSQLIPSRLAHIPGYPCYRTVEETYADLAQLASTHSDLASWVDIGDSWDKVTSGGPAGYDLFALVLTNEARPGPKPRFFLMAAIHARELATAELATRFAEKLVADYGIDPDVTWLLDYFEIHIVPMANPDGRKWAEQGQSWRKNADNANGCTTFPNYGTDLNRNSSFHWGGGSTDPCNENYQGLSAASEPETQAIQNYVASIFPDQRGPGDEDAAPADATGLFLSLHSYGPRVLFPYEFRSTPAPNDHQLETLGRKFGYFNGYPVCQAGEPECMYIASGTIEDWAYGQLGVAAYNFELGYTYSEGCSAFEGSIVPLNMPALLYAFKAARRPYQSPAGPESITVTVSLTSVVAGTPVTLTAVADDTRYNSVWWGTEPVQNIAAARYTVDAPSWITGAISYSIAPADGTFNSSVEAVRAVVNTTGWTPGRHILFVESKDAVGNWGVPSAVFLRTLEDYGVTLTPTVAMKQAYPGQTVSYTLQLTNRGNMSDTFDLAAIGNTWMTTLPGSVGPLAPGISTHLTVTVQVPGSAMGGATDAATIKATSRADNTKSATAALTTTASFNALVVTPPSGSQSADPGAQVTYTLRVTNTGNITDTFDVAVGGNIWTTVAASSVGPLAAGAGAPLSVVVSVPATAPAGARDTAKITLTSQGDPSRSSTSVLTTTANALHGLIVQPAAMGRPGGPGAQVIYTLRVTNTGSLADTFDVAVAGNAWTTAVASRVGPLAGHAGADLEVVVSIPVTATAGATDTVTITLISQAAPSESSTSRLTTEARIVYGLTLQPSAMALSADPGTRVTYTLRVMNLGNVTDTFDVAATGNVWTTALVSALGPLGAGASADLSVNVSVPAAAIGGATDAADITLTSQGDPSQSSASALTTAANSIYGLALKPSTMARSGDPATQVIYTLRVTNTGNTADTFNVAVEGDAWTTIVASRVGPLAVGVGVPLSVTVSVPQTALAGARDTARITLTSQGNPSQSSTSILTTTANTVYGSAVQPTAAARSGDPGAQVAYTLRVTNTGNTADTFDVAVGEDAWATVVASSVGPLAAGVGAPLSVVVSVPATAPASARDTAKITLTSQGSPSRSSTSVLTTTANAVYGLAIQPTALAGSGDPAAQVTYTLRVTNTGNAADTFDVAVEGDAWTTVVASSVGPLAASASAPLSVSVSVPQTALTGARDTTRITLTSRGNPSRSSTSVLTTTANTVYHLAVQPTALAGSGDPGAQVTYTLRVTNTGDITDTFDVIVEGNAWTTIVASRVGPLAASAGAPLSVSVSVPQTALVDAGDTARITLTSRGNPSRSSTSVLTTTANAVHGLVLELPAMAGTGNPGTVVTYTLYFTNTGNTTETFTVDYSGNTWGVQLFSEVSTTLAAGESGNVIVSVTVPRTVTDRLSDAVLVKVTGVDTSQVSTLTTKVVFRIYLPLVAGSP